MAPTPPTTTSRLKLHYSGPFNEHNMVFHGVTGVAQNDLRTAVAAVVTAMVGMCWNATTFDTAEYAPAGSAVFSPDGSWASITRVSSTNPGANDAPSHFTQFGARSLSSGKRAKWYLFESSLRDNDRMRYQNADDADVALVNGLLLSNNAVIGCIDGSIFGVYGYANVGQNDHLTHKARS